MIKPYLKDDAFLQDVRAAAEDREALSLWWLGQSGFLVQWNDRRLLLDPYLSDSLTEKYADTDQPHIRMTERVIAPGRLNDIQVVTSSHNHTDHLDGETLKPLFRANPEMAFVLPEANREFVADRLGCSGESYIGLDAGQHIEAGGYMIHAVPAAHEEIDWDEAGRHRYLGYVVEAGPWKIYHSGDTVHYEGMKEILKPFAVHLALLPINGRRPERCVAGNLFGDEAARLARDIGAGLAIPCHYDMFQFNTESPEVFERTCGEIGQAFRVLQCGERLTLKR